MKMIEFRWLETKDGKVLQYRTCKAYASGVTGLVNPTQLWSDWQTVQTVKESEL